MREVLLSKTCVLRHQVLFLKPPLMAKTVFFGISGISPGDIPEIPKNGYSNKWGFKKRTRILRTQVLLSRTSRIFYLFITTRLFSDICGAYISEPSRFTFSTSRGEF